MDSKQERSLAPREEQIMNVLYRLGKATVAEVREGLSDPPSYSAVRTMLGKLEEKGMLRRDRSEMSHRYLPIKSRRRAALSAARELISTFFSDSPADALAMLIDDSAKTLSDEDIKRLELAIAKARKGDK
ncbi:MAG: BlaI/MecI/CopY family transcriptional regulator [Planctomycetota bacterium]